MMPIFFHVESHLWIAYLFILNGLLIHWLICKYSLNYKKLTKPIEAQILAAFFISISINAGLLLALDWMDLNFELLALILPIITALCLLVLIRSFFGFLRDYRGFWQLPYCRLVLYFLVFLVLFYNGGLIEQVSDAWWHMSLANRIAFDQSFQIEMGHLSLGGTRSYPSLWHGNLALANILSGINLQIFWNSFTSWGAVLKVMSFYLFAFSISKSKVIGFSSAVLFILLPGVGNSYLRVSAWPSHVSYTALFSALYVSMSISDLFRNAALNSFRESIRFWVFHLALVFSLIFLISVMYFAHRTEVLWFVLVLLFYILGLVIYKVFISSSESDDIEPDLLINPLGLVLLSGALAFSFYFLWQQWSVANQLSDALLAFTLPVLFLLVFLLLLARNSLMQQPNQTIGQIAICVLFIVICLSFDGRHLASLFNSELAYSRGAYYGSSLVSKGWFGGDLNTAAWHMQLRGGLLYSGIISVPLSLLMAIINPSRLTIFLSSAACFSFILFSSPYLYHWFISILNYHSPWRISIVIFHPIIIATFISWLFSNCHRSWNAVRNA